MITIPPGNKNLFSGLALRLQHINNQLSSPGTDSGLANKKPFKMLLQICATTSLVYLFLLLVFWKPGSSGTLTFTKSEALELLTSQSTQELLEDEDQLTTGSFLCPGALRLCP